MQIGTWITVAHPTLVDLISKQDFDWVCIDLEHSPVSRLELQTAVQIIQGNGKKAFVRVPRNDHTEIKFPLDSGVDGIIIPMVNSAQEAKEALKSCLYPPLGNRGVGLARAQGYGFAFEEHLKKNLEDLIIIAQVEHIQAVREIDQILALKRLNGVFLGPYDLSGSMNLTGQLTHPDVLEAVQTVASKTLASKKLLGAHVIKPTSEAFYDYRNRGYNFIAFSIDTFFLGQKIADELTFIRSKESGS